MNAVKISHLVAGLGCTYSQLLADSVISNAQLKPAIDDSDNEYLIQRPETGVELWFWAETRVLEKIVFSLIGIFDDASTYRGELPSPLTHDMNRLGIRDFFGEPFESKKPIKILRSRGFGGGDVYHLRDLAHSNTRIGFQYRTDDKVCTVGYSLINPGHD